MVKLINIICSLLFSIGLLAQERGVSLEEAYQTAANKNEQLALAESRIQQGEAQLQEVQANFLPRLGLGMTYQTQQPLKNSPGSPTDYGFAKVTLSQSLYAGGRDWEKTKAFREGLRGEKFNKDYSRNLLYGQVARIFYTVLSSQQEVTHTQTSISLLDKRINEIQKRKQIGKSRNIESLALESQRSLLEAQLQAAMAMERNSRQEFYNVTGLDPQTQLLDNIDLPAQPKELRESLKVVEERPDLQTMKSNVLMKEHLVEVARAEHLPALDLTANYYPYWHKASATASEWDASLTLSFPLFAGGGTQARVRKSLVEKVQAELLLKQRQRAVEVEIATGINNLQSALEQIKTLEKAVATTERNYREQEKDYRFSLATNLDVLQALNAHHEAKKTLVKTRYQALSAAAELKGLLNDLKR